MKYAVIVSLLLSMVGPSASVTKDALHRAPPRHRLLQHVNFHWIDREFARFDWLQSQELLEIWDNCSQGYDESKFVSIFEDPVAFGKRMVENACLVAEETVVQKAFDRFKERSNVDLQSFLENFPVVISEADLSCMFGNFTLNEKYRPLKDRPILSKECAKKLLGPSPLGDLTRAIFLSPDKILPCFARFSSEILECNSKSTQFIPLAGPWLKLATCMVGKAGRIVESFCSAELDHLHFRLPDEYNATTCDTTRTGRSFLLALPKPLLTAPLPDACVRYAQENSEDFNDTVSRYTLFQERCESEWAGWTQASNATSSSAGLPQESTTSGGGVVYPPSSIAWAFFGGMAAGFVIVALFTCLRKRNDRVETFPPVPAQARSSTTFDCEDGQLEDVQFA